MKAENVFPECRDWKKSLKMTKTRLGWVSEAWPGNAEPWTWPPNALCHQSRRLEAASEAEEDGKGQKEEAVVILC